MNLKIKGGKIHAVEGWNSNLGYTLCGGGCFFRNGISKHGDEQTEEPVTCKTCIKLARKE